MLFRDYRWRTISDESGIGHNSRTSFSFEATIIFAKLTNTEYRLSFIYVTERDRRNADRECTALFFLMYHVFGVSDARTESRERIQG